MGRGLNQVPALLGHPALQAHPVLRGHQGLQDPVLRGHQGLQDPADLGDYAVAPTAWQACFMPSTAVLP